MTKKRILIIDDQFAAVDDRKKYFEKDYASRLPFDFVYETGCVGDNVENRIGSVDKAVAGLKNAGHIDLVLLDVMFPGKNNTYMGIEILKKIRSTHPTLPIVMFTTLSRDEFKVFGEAIQNGANDFVGKRFNDFKLLDQTLHLWLDSDIDREHSPRPLYGNSEKIKKLRWEIAKISINSYSRLADIPPVLIVGESGIGKEIVANMIWRLGPRSKGPFQVVECVGLSEPLIESELFGHLMGSFTNASSTKEGLISMADKGVLFLDEIGDLPLSSQAKLLRALQEKKIRKIGSVDSEYVDFQLIAATNKNLEEMVFSGLFREDLYHRVTSGAIITPPPLREIKEDIPLLADMFLKAKSRTGQENLAQDVVRIFTEYYWPGNVRELGGVITRALLSLTDSNTIYSKNITLTLTENLKNEGTVSIGEYLPKDHEEWPRVRILQELKLAVEARRKSKSTAEFVRRMYPESAKSSTAAVKELIKRLSSGPWGVSKIKDDQEIRHLIDELSL